MGEEQRDRARSRVSDSLSRSPTRFCESAAVARECVLDFIFTHASVRPKTRLGSGGLEVCWPCLSFSGEMVRPVI